MGLADPMGKLGTLLFRSAGHSEMRDGLLRLGYELRPVRVMSRRMQSVGGWESWDLKHIAPKPHRKTF